MTTSTASTVLGKILSVGPEPGDVFEPAGAPWRPTPLPPMRTLPPGPTRFVDPAHGNDAAVGSLEAPWRTIQHAMPQLGPGDTLCLRGGVYFENVICSIIATAQQPVTIRSYPGEQAIIDASIPEFQLDPAAAWMPAPDGPPGTFVSRHTFKNQRDMVGMFVGSMIGLTSYWYRRDLEATNEYFERDAQGAFAPVYLGPGLWFEQQTGRVYCRLAPTHLKLPDSVPYKIPNYKGPQDPRQLPLLVAPFRAMALLVDQAQHVRFQDLVFRGGGYQTVDLRFAISVEFDRCTFYAGTYGIWAKNSGPVRITQCAFRGSIPPWAYRWENGLYAYSPYIYPPFVTTTPGYQAYEREAPWQKEEPSPRHLARLNSHALMVMVGFYEHEVFAYPFNHDWEIDHCEFADAHEAAYLGGRSIDFHHNLVTGLQDDAIYISSPSPMMNDKIFVHHNVVTVCTIALGLHRRGGPGGDIYIYRNVIDMRGYVKYNRPKPQTTDGGVIRGSRVLLVHGYASAPLLQENLHLYQNTFVFPNFRNSFASGMMDWVPPKTKRVLLNNLMLSFSEDSTPPTFNDQERENGLFTDGNLYWHVGLKQADPALVSTLRTSKGSIASQQAGGSPWDGSTLHAEPSLETLSGDFSADNDYRLRATSPARGAGVVLPAGWVDPERPAHGNPDIGALPAGGSPLRVGIDGRAVAGLSQTLV